VAIPIKFKAVLVLRDDPLYCQEGPQNHSLDLFKEAQGGLLPVCGHQVLAEGPYWPLHARSRLVSLRLSLYSHVGHVYLELTDAVSGDSISPR
jgi:hypothetical protein